MGSIVLNLQFSGLSEPDRWSPGRDNSPQPGDRLNKIGLEMALPLETLFLVSVGLILCGQSLSISQANFSLIASSLLVTGQCVFQMWLGITWELLEATMVWWVSD